MSKMSTPLDFLNLHVKLFKFFGIFGIESESKPLRVLSFIHGIGTQFLFCDIGCVLFTIPLLFFPPAKEALQIIFVMVAYMNAVVKGKIFFFKRKELKALWLKLYDSDYAAIGDAEHE